MALHFYPHEENIGTSPIEEKLEVLMDAAERYKGDVLDAASKATVVAMPVPGEMAVKRIMPRDITMAYNWEEIAEVLREVRGLPEATPQNRSSKADKLAKLAEIYEVLRSAKMPKLEGVRLALVNEANQLRVSAA